MQCVYSINNLTMFRTIMKLLMKNHNDKIQCVFGDSIHIFYEEDNIAFQCILISGDENTIITTRHVDEKHEVQINTSVLINVLDRFIKVVGNKPVSLNVSAEQLTLQLKCDESGAVMAEASISYVMSNENTKFKAHELLDDLDTYKYLDIPIDKLSVGLALCKKSNDLLEISLLPQTCSIKLETKEIMSSTRFFITYPMTTSFFEYNDTYSKSHVGDLDSMVSCVKNMHGKIIRAMFDDGMIALSYKSHSIVMMVIVAAQVKNI